MKSINPIKYYLHIIKLNGCVLKLLVIVFWLNMAFLISCVKCSTPKSSKYAT